MLLLTRSVSEARKHISIDSISHQRKLQCLYALCVIFFNTNHTCSVPMHLLLTDLVEAQGGSSESRIQEMSRRQESRRRESRRQEMSRREESRRKRRKGMVEEEWSQR